MRKYEIMIAVRGSLVDSEQKAAFDRLVARLKKDAAQITFEESWGKLTLGYKIAHESEAHYHVVQFTMDSTKVKGLELFLELDQDIIRSLISKVEEETPFTKEMYDAGMDKYIASRRERQTKAMPKTRATTAVQLQEEMQKIGDKQEKTKMTNIIKDLSL